MKFLPIVLLTGFLSACSPKSNPPEPIMESQIGLERSAYSTTQRNLTDTTETAGLGGAPSPPTEEEIYLRGYNENVFEEVGLKPYPNVVVDSGMRASKNSRSTELWHLSALFGTEDSVEVATKFYIKQLSDGKAIPITSNGTVRIEGVTEKQVVLTVKISKGESKTQISIEADYPKNLKEN